MTWRDRAAVTALVAVLAIVAAGMLVPPPPVPVAAASPQVVAPAYREGVLGHPSSINPLTYRTQADRDLVALIFRSLVRIGPDGTPRPDLAAWKASDDGRTYTFAILPGAYWHDGVRVSAADVLYTVGILQNPEYTGALGASWHGIKAQALSTYVVEFDLTAPLAGFLNMATVPLLPVHAVAGTPLDELADSDFSHHPLGNGPFRLAEYDDSHAILERMRDIQPADEGLPLAAPATTPAPALRLPVVYETLSEIELRFFDTPQEMANEFAAGDLEAVGSLPNEGIVKALDRKGARLIEYPGSTMAGVVLNLRPEHPEFRAADVRKGLLAAIDRDAIVAGNLGGHGIRADVPVPQSSPSYDASAVTAIPYNPADAASALVKGGWRQTTNGSWAFGTPEKPVEIELLAPTAAADATAYATAGRVATSWEAIGLTVTVRTLTTASYVAALRAGDFDAAVVDIELGLDLDLWPLLSSTEIVTGGTNIAGYQNGDLDALLTKARKATDRPARLGALREIETFLCANQPILPLYFQNYPMVVARNVENLSPRELADPSGRYWDVIDWRLASDG